MLSFEIIDLNSFWNIWYWMLTVVAWSMNAHFTMGVWAALGKNIAMRWLWSIQRAYAISLTLVASIWPPSQALFWQAC